jgi:hypothetical protein
MEQYMNETIGVRLPDGEHVSLRLPVKYTEDDIDIAIRTAKSFLPGSVLTIDGCKFKVLSQDPPRVEEVLSSKKKASHSSAPEAPVFERKLVAVQVGQRWVTKDSRRSQEPFEVVRVEGDVLITDKGAKIGLHRLSRYKLVS